MAYKIPEFKFPDFQEAKYQEMPSVTYKEAESDGILPDSFYLTTHLPTFYKLGEEWILPKYNSLNCVAVVEDDDIVIREMRDVKAGDKIISGSTTDGSQGILVYKEGFPEDIYSQRSVSVETSFSQDYDKLFDIMEHEKNNGGHISWVLGPAVVFDHDTRNALVHLAENGYIHSLLGGNAMTTHDLEGGFLNTALGQNIYTQENAPMGHYNHLDLLNEVRTAGSIKNFNDAGNVKDGIIKALTEMDIPIVLSGSIRDDGPLPEVMGSTSQALTETKKILNEATLIICIATMLHSNSVASLASSYKVGEDGKVRPVYFYTIDITENVVNKVGAAREYMAYHPMVTNVQDFCVACEKALVTPAQGEMAKAVEDEEYETVEVENNEDAAKGELGNDI
ncbi:MULTISPECIES: fused N-dimethylarginine dimethylaminohydrolase/saccharopine dehydrogenase domain-containing protein [Aerococcus]|uniref:Fused N-dimethylarginine dimethylaminohydrolase/saccharopine dehydrogenase domain-containing protein n=1 Tax=Aerococcus mictus TaxID=2976810 RepID=A0A1E9PHY1_9LACT|nr:MULTISPECIES: fused N-dimethylarginine dimethylaminohydrolase/saccharopine dehydrogenase domain-containing protein [Aerococcus]MBU5610871.1 fused N-dimethylarginine dimethylaminohydrolase/saccharopine dehydrogenase domain-containing protein [Aerococcus urinae]MCY3033650.1 fused N-dimethylarginine dimethylaminohydrolase/saccharopine dehydrogenase domain-containing protein [Aerococcus mictus]MCY3062939.1 fused N-dimethylarginine dimethylaminohydrolase/saccharopine dehydrogenase domain-containin